MRLLGTFLLCLSLLVYEVFCTRLLAVVVGDHLIYYVFALAMLGMSFACSLMSVVRWRPAGRRRELAQSFLCLALGVCFAATLVAVTLVNQHLNARFASVADAGGLAGLIEHAASSSALVTVLVGALLALPYFVFGVAITYLFESARSESYHRLYFADLLGAAAGCVLCIVALERGGYSGALSVVLPAPFLAAAAFAPSGAQRLRHASLTAGAAALWIAWQPAGLAVLEPQPEPSRLSRDYDRRYAVEPRWHTWNSYVRVSLLDIHEAGNGHGFQTYALGNGTGWATLRRFAPSRDGDSAEPGGTSTGLARLAVALQPKRALVVFAGVGSDMIQMDALCQGRCEITGVELNRQMVEHALAQEESGLRRFLERPHVDLVVAEGREYLERHDRRYDAILLSWSGATFAHYVGTAGHTTQYLYTKQAFESLLDHLAPGGMLVVANTNKAQQILIFREIFEERGWDDLARSLIVLQPPGSAPDKTRWDRIWDENRLLVRPGGFGQVTLARIREVAAASGHRMLYGPGVSDPDFGVYRRLVEAEDVSAVVREVEAERKLRLSVPTDDRPFALDMAPRGLLLERSFWLPDAAPAPDAPWRILRRSTLFLVGASLAATALILAPLFLRRGPRPTRRNLQHLVFFTSIGAGFMLVEVGLVQKLGLLLGNPGLSMAVVLAAVIVSTGLGSLASGRFFARRLGFPRVVIALLALLILDLLALHVAVPVLLAWPLGLKCAVVVVLLFPLGFLMGQLFPQALRRLAEGEPLVPWAWAVNGASSTLAAGLGVALAPALGFSAVVLAGAAFYALILALPAYWRA